MSELFLHEEEIAFYSPRSGESVARAVEVLKTPPEHPLDEHEREEVLTFERELFNARFHDGAISYEANVEGDLFYLVRGLGYGATVKLMYTNFLKSDVAGEVFEKAGIQDAFIASDNSTQSLYALAEELEPGQLRKLADQSKFYAKNQIAQALVDDAPVPEPETVKVFTTPENLTVKLKNLTEYKNFLHEIRELLKTEDTTLSTQAKLSVVDIYIKVVNQELAQDYPNVFALWDQLRLTNNTEAMTKLSDAWPNGEHLSLLPSYARQKYIVGLDRIRNGTSLTDGKFSAITTSLEELAENVEAQKGTEHLKEHSIFSPEEVEKLSTVMLNAEQMQEFCKMVLAQLGKLSDEPETSYVRGRKQRAADGKWQVIIDESVSSLEVKGDDGVLVVPKEFNRSLTRSEPPIGVISGAAHEIGHIFQIDTLSENTGSLILTKELRGRSSMALREAGGILIEQEVQAQLFGQHRDYETYYMHALKDMEAGKPLSEVIKNSYNLRRERSHDGARAAATNTFDRIARLRRYGGFDSQPLNYLQSALIIEASKKLSDVQKNQLFAEGAFDLPDMVTLHKYGLDSSSPDAFPVDQFIGIATTYLQGVLKDQ